MPVCNGMPWLPEAIESLLRQTTANFEILAIVDGGCDSSLAYLRGRSAAQTHGPRLRVLEQPNAGVTATLNRLLEETRTPWLVRQDADDVSYPQRIEKLLGTIRRYPDAGLIYSLADYHPRELCAGTFRCSRGTPEELRSIVEHGYLLSICHSTVALNVEKARAVGGYRMDIHAEDADLWWRMARKFEIRCIPEALVGFRQNALSVSARHGEKQQLAGLYVQYLLLSELWNLSPRPLSDVAATLLGFLRPAQLRAKEALRQSNMHLGERRVIRSLGSLARAAWASPRYVAGRIADEFRHTAIANGVAPSLFIERKEALWS
ncbi:MAG TPA: glycosyltransferase family 2 protein [Acidobacteriaceae bacterium]|nr:glycosyltransferase family 2 protein [Acidobacteriaceae bacterium]